MCISLNVEFLHNDADQETNYQDKEQKYFKVWDGFYVMKTLWESRKQCVEKTQ